MKSTLNNLIVWLSISGILIISSLTAAVIAGADCLGGNCDSPANKISYFMYAITLISVGWSVVLVIKKLSKRNSNKNS